MSGIGPSASFRALSSIEDKVIHFEQTNANHSPHFSLWLRLMHPRKKISSCLKVEFFPLLSARRRWPHALPRARMEEDHEITQYKYLKK
jgi:hypothetical protein